VGHTVDLLAQDAQARELDWVDAIGSLRTDGAILGVEVGTARRLFGWDGVAAGVIAAGQGDHGALAPVPVPASL